MARLLGFGLNGVANRADALDGDLGEFADRIVRGNIDAAVDVGCISLAPGDAIDDLFLGAGKPGDKQCQLLVDDVTLLGLD